MYAAVHRREGQTAPRLVPLTGPGGDEDPLPLPAVEAHPVAVVAIADLLLSRSPRLGGEDPHHTRALADVCDQLPPILVHAPTMQVIDGMHRVRAALLNGGDSIEARLIDCDEATAWVLAVRVNVTHGLPLSTDDRKSAALSIIGTHPLWSDRTIAASTGLSDKTVSNLRARTTADGPQSDTRVGRDGRVRPVNSGALRRRAAELLSARPDAGLREIARATGLSPATVRDVRLRTARGEDPVPAKYREPATIQADVPRSGQRGERRGRTRAATALRAVVTEVDRTALLSKLMNDPSMRFTAGGRYTVRWLYQYALDVKTLQGLAQNVPDHWAGAVADLARGCAERWLNLADQLEGRRAADAV
jgi:ParB-like chromosome segregation protein Spo0J